jgi:hypothetical protein
MAIASVLVGIITGFTLFVVALATGYGFVIAFSMYVVGGFIGALALAAFAATRAVLQQGNRTDRRDQALA